MKLFRIHLLLYISLLFCGSIVNAQNDYPQDYFRSPINGRIYLSGTFGELRGNHFHAGIDIKTGGVEGKNIYSAADGWVSRVKISPWGYGNAIYIEHPNGYTTVYGHLKEIKGEVANYIEAQQHNKQSFAVDLYLNTNQFKVNKGDIIALSGNSGGSGGPHLHFEIRETANQEPINPLLFGIKVKDFITPVIKSLRIYPANNNTLINGDPEAENFVLEGWGENYKFKNGDSIPVHGDFYLGIATVDKQNDSHNKNGVYEIELYADSSLVFKQNVERLNFSTTRYINTLIDYEYYKNKKRRYQRTYISPNNKLSIYKKVENKGIFSFNDNEYHHFKYVVKDLNGNKSILQFTIHSFLSDTLKAHSEKIAFNPLQENNYKDADLQIYFPERCLYDSIIFDSVIRSIHKHSLTPVFHIGKPTISLQKRIAVKISNVKMSESYKKKAFVGKINKNSISAYNAKWSADQLEFKTRNFGKYGVFIDSIPPVVTQLTKTDKIRASKKIVLKVVDKESGISKYDAWLNGKWVILQYDPKKNKMIFESKKGFNLDDTFLVKIEDAVGNQTKHTIDF